MGTFFTNLHIRSADHLAVAGALRLAGALPAYVTEAADGWVSAYPQATEEQDVDLLERMAEAVSGALEAAVLAFLVHDSDVFIYLLSEDGATVDRYNSRPNYFGGDPSPPEGGEAARLVPLARPGTRTRQIEEILSNPDAEMFAEDLVRRLAALLAIPAERAAIGYAGLTEGDFATLVRE
jgi:hypothetical protein